jgi:hypothetical protein
VAGKISTCASILRPALLLALALILAGPVRAAGRPYEIAGAERELGRIRELAERLSKQNLLYQLHLAGQTKQDLVDTVAELDRVVELLRKGSVTYSVAPPPNEEVRAQIDKLDEAWGPLRRMALASPYDYLRRGQEFMPREHRLGDPLFIRAFDRMSQAVILEVDRLMALYDAECMKTGYELCGLATTSGLPTMLVERMVKELIFVHAGLDAGRNADRLRENRDAVDAHHLLLQESPLMAEATAPARGNAGAFVSSLWSSINEDWDRLRLQVELAIAGRADEIDLKRVLKIQDRLVETWERFTVVMVRFANAREER